MYLNKILGSTTKINTLAVLVSNAKTSFIEIELAKESGIAVSEVNRQMKDLTATGLITMEKIGKSKVYRVNIKHFLYMPLKRLFRSLEDIYQEITSEVVEYLTRRYELKAIILFGSLPRGKIRSDLVKEPSDVDLLVVAEKKEVDAVKETMIRFVNEKISSRYGITIFPIVLSVEEYLRGLSKDQFIIDVQAAGKVLYGEKPRRFS